VLNYKDTRWGSFGLNEELKARGIYDADKVTLTAAIVPPAPATKLPSAATIAAMKGDATRGGSLVQSCFLCHRLGDKGVDYAPNLTGFASRQTAETIIGAIIDPSADISHGYEGTEITLKDNTIIDGIVHSNSNPVVVQSTGGVTQMIPRAKIKTQQNLRRSLMLSADQLGLGAQELADIVAYLKSQP
jgi:putative heme-binding domain-containing protein